jgi:hypothetical protein
MLQNPDDYVLVLYEVKPYGAVSHDLETDLHVLVQAVQDSFHIQDSVPLHLVVIYMKFLFMLNMDVKHPLTLP